MAAEEEEGTNSLVGIRVMATNSREGINSLEGIRVNNTQSNSKPARALGIMRCSQGTVEAAAPGAATESKM